MMFRKGLASAASDAQALLADFENAALEVSPRASLYANAARASLRLAIEAIAWRDAREGYAIDESSSCDAWPKALGFDLRVSDPVRGIGVRFRTGDAACDPGYEIPPSAPLPSLAIALLASEEVRRLAKGPIFASLLGCALESQEWIEPRSGALWRPDPRRAQLLVEILSGGRPVIAWDTASAGGLIDATVEGAISSVGWRLFRPTRLSPDAEGAAVSAMGLT